MLASLPLVASTVDILGKPKFSSKFRGNRLLLATLPMLAYLLFLVYLLFASINAVAGVFLLTFLLLILPLLFLPSLLFLASRVELKIPINQKRKFSQNFVEIGFFGVSALHGVVARLSFRVQSLCVHASCTHTY
jgi:hypothetical protein